MKYYLISESRKPNVIGHYPQTMRTKNEGYHVDSFDSERRIKAGEFPDFDPKYGIDLNPKALATDIIDKSSLSFGFVVSERLRLLLMDFKLPPYRFYPIDVFGTKNVYYWFHYITDVWKYIDFESTEIEVVHKFKFNVEKTVKFSSFKDVMDFKKSLPRQNTIRFGSIRLNEDFPNYDIFELTGPKYFTLISEDLKESLTNSNITGVDFVEYERISKGPTLI